MMMMMINNNNTHKPFSVAVLWVSVAH